MLLISISVVQAKLCSLRKIQFQILFTGPIFICTPQSNCIFVFNFLALFNCMSTSIFSCVVFPSHIYPVVVSSCNIIGVIQSFFDLKSIEPFFLVLL